MITFFPETLPANTSKLFDLFVAQKPPFLESFYLSGGTALSLQLGHRESEDLDFFSTVSFDPIKLQSELTSLGRLSDLELFDNTLNTKMDDVKLQFLGYPYPILEPLIDYRGIKLSSILDIALTKLQTIGMRGSKKDFIDLYVIFGKYSLQDILPQLSAKYPGVDYNIPHILKSLVYFKDADNQPIPRLHQDINWEDVKIKMIQIIKSL